jgi:hypothetical protein
MLADGMEGKRTSGEGAPLGDLKYLYVGTRAFEEDREYYDLDSTIALLNARGWRADSGPFGIADGPCYRFTDRSGNELAIFGNVRPDVLSGVRPR